MKNESSFYEVAAEIDIILLSESTKMNISRLFRIIRKESTYENYFFSKALNTSWFHPLKEEGYFSPDRAPALQETDEKGYHRIPEWEVLPYLERVSKQVEISENEKYIEELLEIIRNVSAYKDSEGKGIDDYRIWWFFVKILLNIPSDRIGEDIIDLIPIWFASKFDISLPAADIGTKLLPKFLGSNSRDDWEKAERIINIISAIRWEESSKERRTLGREDEPKTVLDTYWLLESLRENADKIAERCSEKVIFNLADNLKQIFRRLGPAYLTIEFGGNKYQMAVEELSDFEYSIRIVLEKEVLGKDLSWESESTFRLVNCGDKKAFVERVKRRLLKRQDFKGLKDELDKRLEGFYDRMPQDASFIWFRDLFSEPELGIHGTDEALTTILRDIVLAKARQDGEFVKQTIFPEFCGPKYRYPIFRRIALFITGKEWDTFKDYFWQLMGTEDDNSLFGRAVFEPELYTLLETNIIKFTSEEKERIKAIIAKGPQEKGYTERQMSHWKQKWYSAVKANPLFFPLYEKQRKVTDAEEEISFKRPKTWVKISGAGYSSLSVEEVLDLLRRKELARYLIEFKPSGISRDSNIESLASVLKSAVQEKPDEFIESLSDFLNVPYCYVHHILWGIRDAWAIKKFFDWGTLFEFMKEYIDRDSFWKDQFRIEDDRIGIVSNADHLWVAGIIGELIQEGTKNDAWAFSEDLFQSAKDILFLILDRQESEEPGEDRDAVNHALNSGPGKVITALIYLALRIARLEAKKGAGKKVKWSSDMKEGYKKALDGEVVEAYTLFGQYIGNLSYLDGKWVEETIQSISPSEKLTLWEAFMEGYLSGGSVYQDLYELMRSHFTVAIDHEFKRKHIGKRLVQYICIGYLSDNKDLAEGSLFGRLLKKWETSQIQETIEFLWRQHGHSLERTAEKKAGVQANAERKQTAKKVIDFWRWVYENHYKAASNIDDDDRRILSALCLLAEALPEINLKNLEWLRLSARYVETRFNSNFFIEYLDRLKDEKCYVGEIFVDMLGSSVPYPHTKEPHVRSIVEHLYKTDASKCKDSADKICNIYGENGYDFLRDLYEKYK